MAIQPNANPESALILGSAWISKDEDKFRADAENQRKLAESAASGADAVSTAGAGTADSLRGNAGNALQDKLGEESNALNTSGDRHAEAASHLDAAAINIEEAKAAMNATDDQFHTQLAATTAQAAVEGWTPLELEAAKSSLVAQAQSAIANIQAGFSGAYEGVVTALDRKSVV